jgi:hypothetical protein
MVDMHTTRARAVLVGLSVCWAAIAYGLWNVRTEEVLWPAVWTPLFLAATAATVWLAATLSRPPLFLSMVLLTAGFGGRITASLYRALAEDIALGRVAVAAGVFTALFVLVANAWIRVLGPIVSWHEQQKGAT